MGTFSYEPYIMGMKQITNNQKNRVKKMKKNLETILEKAPCADLQCEDVRYDSVTNYLSDTSEILSWYTEDGHSWNIKDARESFKFVKMTSSHKPTIKWQKYDLDKLEKDYKELKKHIAYVRRNA